MCVYELQTVSRLDVANRKDIAAHSSIVMFNMSASLTFLSVLVAISMASAPTERCRLGYRLAEDNLCYMVISPSRIAFGSMWAAASFCRQNGGQLATVTSNNVKMLIKFCKFEHGWYYYVDGTDAAQEGLWVRTNSDDIILLSDPMWGPGQPANEFERAHCAGLGQYGYHDILCEYQPNATNPTYPVTTGVICEQIMN
jgi:putative hemolysin